MPDPRLKKIARDQLPPDLQTLWDNAMRDRDEATLIEVAGNAPEVLDWYYNSFYSLMFYGGRVAVRIKQLARMKLSTMHGCAFCNRGNSKEALADGVTQAQLDALLDVDSAVFDDRERAVLRLCEEMTLANMDG
jgi:alkylhydroperoxidase family enzyme